MTCTIKPQRSTSQITDLTTANISLAELEEHGIRRTICNHFLYKLDTIIAKTVLIGSLGDIEYPMILPPL